MTTYLPDVNVWVALALEAHAHHGIAMDWFESVGNCRIRICRVTETGLLRLLTNKHVTGGYPLSAGAAWRVVDAIREDPRVEFVSEPEGFGARWRKTSSAGKVTPGYWTDAYLASLCFASGATLVTFDRGLARRKDCLVRLLVAR